MPSSYIQYVAPKWAATSNATISNRTVQYWPHTTSGTANAYTGNVYVHGTGTDFDVDFHVGDTLVANSEVRVITAINSATNISVNAAFTNAMNGKALTKVHQFVVPGNGGWNAANYLRGTTISTASNAHLTGTSTAWTTNLVDGDRILVMGADKHAVELTVVHVVSATNVAITPTVSLANAHSVFKLTEVLHTIPDLDSLQ
ncbi:MAG: hypothetical protein EBU90_10995 [Proteobacteria bacterium]|nr:hypothetical protein [Pseudomonadota bacterium]NBP14433.1 hypothetical protein [bacterium]